MNLILKWKDIELEKMKAGGNQKAREFFESQDDWNDSMSINQKYNTTAAALYRDKIATLAQGKEWDLRKAQSSAAASKSSGSSAHHSSGITQSQSSGALSSSYQNGGGGGYQEGYQNINTQEFRDQKESYFNRKQNENAMKPEGLPPNQGGKYVSESQAKSSASNEIFALLRYAGFGNTRDPPPRSQSQEVFDTTLSTLASVIMGLKF